MLGTSAEPGDGFGFTYELMDPPLRRYVPEPSTWAIMLVGFAGLAFAGYRARADPRQQNMSTDKRKRLRSSLRGEKP